MSNGKTDMRGKRITVLSEQGRENWDKIFGKKPDKKKQETTTPTTKEKEPNG